MSRSATGLLARPVSRRHALGLGAAAVVTPWLAACTGSGDPGESTPPGGGALTGEVTWWDQFRPLTGLFTDEVFTPYAAAHPGATVARRELDGPALGQALQLARRSSQSPDVHSLAGLDGTPAALVAAGWFQPIDDFVDIASSPVADRLLDGIHKFDGKVYSFPVFSGRWHDAVPWFNSALVQGAGLDPADQPRSWDDFRSTLRTVTQQAGDGVQGVVVPSKVPVYLNSLVERLAMAAGSPGTIDPRTGAYTFDSQPFLDAMEFLVSLQKDGLVHSGSASMDTRDARSRWAAGEAVAYLWGPWFIGGLKVQEPAAVQRGVGVWHIPTPGGGSPMIYSPPPAGTFWVSSQAKLPKLGADVMLSMVEPEFLKKLAGAMDQPPILDELVAQADVEDAYRTNVEYMASDVRFAPQPQVRNADVSKAMVEMRPVNPTLGEIAQAVLTGADPNYTAALKTLNGAMTTERERAVTAAVDKGAQVSLEDWVFSDWQPGQDYQ